MWPDRPIMDRLDRHPGPDNSDFVQPDLDSMDPECRCDIAYHPGKDENLNAEPDTSKTAC